MCFTNFLLETASYLNSEVETSLISVYYCPVGQLISACRNDLNISLCCDLYLLSLTPFQQILASRTSMTAQEKELNWPSSELVFTTELGEKVLSHGTLERIVHWLTYVALEGDSPTVIFLSSCNKTWSRPHSWSSSSVSDRWPQLGTCLRLWNPCKFVESRVCVLKLVRYNQSLKKRKRKIPKIKPEGYFVQRFPLLQSTVFVRSCKNGCPTRSEEIFKRLGLVICTRSCCSCWISCQRSTNSKRIESNFFYWRLPCNYRVVCAIECCRVERTKQERLQLKRKKGIQ